MKREHRILAGQKQSVSIGAGHVLDLRIGLPLILLEGQREPSEAGLKALAHCRGNRLRPGSHRGRQIRMRGMMISGGERYQREG
jgi:hypothetical protein